MKVDDLAPQIHVADSAAFGAAEMRSDLGPSLAWQDIERHVTVVVATIS